MYTNPLKQQYYVDYSTAKAGYVVRDTAKSCISPDCDQIVAGPFREEEEARDKAILLNMKKKVMV